MRALLRDVRIRAPLLGRDPRTDLLQRRHHRNDCTARQRNDAQCLFRVKLRKTGKEQIISASPLATDIIKHERDVGKVPTTEVAFSLDHPVGEREKRRGIVRLSAVLWGVLTGSLRAWSTDSSASRAKKTCFAPWGGVNWL